MDNQVFLKKMEDDEEVRHQHWLAVVGDDDNVSGESSFGESSSMEDSTNSVASCSSSELAEDATSATSTSSSSSFSADHANGPLYELSELMAQLPIKRGLSKFYQGKSQSHTSLASVQSLEDLAKKGNHYRTKMKSSKSYAWGLDVQKSCISKNKGSRGSVLSSMAKKTSSFVAVSSRDKMPPRINIC